MGMGSPSTTLGLQYAQCRSLGHEWKHQGFVTDETDPGFRRPMGAEYGSVGYRSQCVYCLTQRIKWLGRRGSLGPTRYFHPDGYERRGEDKLTQEEWRGTWLVSLLGEPEKPANIATIGKRTSRRKAS